MQQGGDKGYLRISLGVIILVIASGMLFGVWGYTSAKVENGAVLTIVASADALIAVNIPSPVNISKGSSDNCGTITNNKADEIEITVSGDVYANALYLSPGDSTNLIIQIPSEETTGEHNYSETVAAYWPGGQAEINFEVQVNVQDAE